MKPTTTLLTTFILAPFAALLCSGASAVSADFVLVDAAARIPPAPIIIPKDAPASIREAPRKRWRTMSGKSVAPNRGSWKDRPRRCPIVPSGWGCTRNCRG